MKKAQNFKNQDFHFIKKKDFKSLSSPQIDYKSKGPNYMGSQARASNAISC